MRMIDVKARAIGGDHVGNTDGVRIYDRHGVIALEIETAAVTQGMFFTEIPPGARSRVQRSIGYDGMRRGHDG